MQSNLESIRLYQQESLQQRKAELEKAQTEYEEYLASEKYQKDLWESGQDYWERKAKKEGWTYTRKPFVSAADRQRMEQEAKEQEIAFLKEKLAALEQ